MSFSPANPTPRPPEPWPHLVRTFETLCPETLPDLVALYAPEARFKDPFNDVRGGIAIERIFRHMYAQLADPVFHVETLVAQGHQAFVTWNFDFRRQGHGTPVQRIHGATHWVLDDAGRLALHRDYWDTAESLYEHLPGLGWVLRRIKQRLRA